MEKFQKGEISRLEPENSPIDGDKPLLSKDYSHLERETGIEPAAFSLARRRSTGELLPLRYAQRKRILSNLLFYLYANL